MTKHLRAIGALFAAFAVLSALACGSNSNSAETASSTTGLLLPNDDIMLPDLSTLEFTQSLAGVANQVRWELWAAPKDDKTTCSALVLPDGVPSEATQGTYRGAMMGCGFRDPGDLPVYPLGARPDGDSGISFVDGFAREGTEILSDHFVAAPVVRDGMFVMFVPTAVLDAGLTFAVKEAGQSWSCNLDSFPGSLDCTASS